MSLRQEEGNGGTGKTMPGDGTFTSAAESNPPPAGLLDKTQDTQ